MVLIYSCIDKDQSAINEPASESEEDPSKDWTIEVETLEVSTETPTETPTSPAVESVTQKPVVRTTKETTQPYVDIITDEIPEGYEMYYTEDDIIIVAKTIYGEAGSYWINRRDKAKVAWTICNRVDDYRYPNSIARVVQQPDQFHGYSSTLPVTDECYEIAKDVLTRWSLEKQGVDVYREVSKATTAFYGNGYENFFYEY
jgi:hypothetical protein